MTNPAPSWLAPVGALDALDRAREALARDGRVALSGLVGPCRALLPLFIDPRLWSAWLAYLVLCVVVAALDGIRAVPARSIGVEVHAPPQVYISTEASLRVDGRLIKTWRVPTSVPPDRGRIVLLNYTTTMLDNLRIEGTVDSLWWRGQRR